MKGILDFLADYYILFIILSVILLFALIGFIAGERKKNKKGVQTASATDLPISNTDDTPQPTNVVVAPEAPVMMSEPVTSSPIQMDTPVVNDTTTSEIVAPVTPEVEVSNEPTLIIDEPVQSTDTVFGPETPVMMNEPITSAPIQMDTPVVNNTTTPEVVAPVTPEVEVSNEPALVIDEPVQMEAPVVNETITPEVEVPSVDNNVVLEPTMDNTAEPSLVIPEPTQNENVLEPVMEPQNTDGNSIFENPDMTGTTSIFENEINNQNN